MKYFPIAIHILIFKKKIIRLPPEILYFLLNITFQVVAFEPYNTSTYNFFSTWNFTQCTLGQPNKKIVPNHKQKTATF